MIVYIRASRVKMSLLILHREVQKLRGRKNMLMNVKSFTFSIVIFS